MKVVFHLRLAYAAINREELRKRYPEVVAKGFHYVAYVVYATLCQTTEKYIIRFGKK